MTRRALLAGLGGQAGRLTPPVIIDTHTHFYDPYRPQGVPWPRKEETLLYRRVLPEDYKKIVKPLGVTGTVVVEASPWVEDNQWVLDLAKDEPFIVGLVGHLEVGTPEFKKNLERFRKNRLFLGIRVGGALRSAAHIEDYRRLEDAGLELDVLVGWAALSEAVRLAERLPALRIVINHLPGAEPPARAVLKELAARPRVFAKVSGVPVRSNGYRERLDELWELFGRDRLIYGSDWPVSEKVAPYAAVLRAVREYFAGKGEEASERFFWKNSRVAYRWGQRA